MPYILVDDFRGGLDTRRLDGLILALFVTLKNAHITRGGEIEKRQAFVSLATLPTNTFASSRWWANICLWIRCSIISEFCSRHTV